jgi:mannose/fructose/N-acetylgalactosamine-specific phosphotransferase system component IIC
MEIAWLLLVLWGGWVAVDATAFGQFMLSRPLVACLVAGWIMGAPTAVILPALLLEAAHLGVLPVGASRYPEGGPAAVVAGGTIAATQPSFAVTLTVVVFALAWEWVSGRTVPVLRNFNVRFVAHAPIEIRMRRHGVAMLLDFVRGAALVALGLLLLAVLLPLVGPPLAPIETAAAFVLMTGLVVLLAGAARQFGGHERVWIVGLLCGALYLVLR